MSEETDDKWLAGYKAARRRMIEESARWLDDDDPLKQASDWIAERADVIVKLRELCAAFGDNDWPDELHLGDVLEKHLFPHLDWPEEEP